MPPEGLFVGAPEETDFAEKGCLVETDVFFVDM